MHALIDVEPAELPARLRPLVHRTITVWRPDGQWPDAEVLHEVLKAYVDFLDVRLDESGVTLLDLEPEDARFVEACRECARSPERFADLVAEYRGESSD